MYCWKWIHCTFYILTINTFCVDLVILIIDLLSFLMIHTDYHILVYINYRYTPAVGRSAGGGARRAAAGGSQRPLCRGRLLAASPGPASARRRWPPAAGFHGVEMCFFFFFLLFVSLYPSQDMYPQNETPTWLETFLPSGSAFLSFWSERFRRSGY